MDPALWLTLLVIALAMIVSTLLVSRRVRAAELAHPPLGAFLEVGGVRLHYVDRGQGPPLVLLHGNGSMIQELEISGLLRLASAHYRVIAFDRPGFGYSERPRGRIWNARAQAALLNDALRRLGVARYTVVGHSWGTQVALALALDHPAQVSSLVLLSGYYFPSFRIDVAFAAGPAIPLLGVLIRYPISPWLGRLMWPAIQNVLFSPAPVPARFAAFPLWLALRPRQLRAAAAESAMMIPNAAKLRHRYGELQMPVMIMAGAGDRVANPQQQSAALHQVLARSELRLAPGMGHMVHHLAPDQVMELIDEAMRQGSVAATAESGPRVRRIPLAPRER